MQGTTFLSFSSVSFGISFEHAVQLPFTVFLYSTFPDNYAFLSLSPTQIKNIQSADTVPIHGHSPLVVKWCDSHEVDFRSPSVSQIADFLLHLFKVRKLQPSIIEGYRTAIADMVGNDRLNISKDENLTRLLDSFHWDKPKGRRGVASWNLSLVLHQLTKALNEPMRKASLKHLTFKTVFLLALGSGKMRSEIHAWLYRNIRHQENWSQVSLYPSPSFISKNQLAREGPASVAAVVIPALAPSLDKSLKEDKSLCPVRALHLGPVISISSFCI